MVLPAELIDHIFSYLQKDISALRACSKAHPSYSKLAERYLYAYTIIDPEALEVCALLENPRLLDYPRTLEIRPHLPFIRNPLPLLIMPIIPRMSNLVSLKIYNPCRFDQKEEFISRFRICLQQSSFQKLYLSIYGIRLSVLDDAKNVKHLTLSDCTAEDEPILRTSSSHLSLETLVLSGDHNSDIHRGAMRWVTRLTTLELRIQSLDLDWMAFPELLVACSNSLKRLHLDMFGHCYNTIEEELPFTLSALMRLERFSISARIIRNQWALPEIMRVANTAPCIQDIDLRFDYFVSDSIISLGQLNWSLLDNLQSNFTGKRPRIGLCVTVEDTLPERILGALAANEALMDLVRRGEVVLGSDL